MTDINGIPLSGVEVYTIDHYGYKVKELETDADGKYSFFLGSYCDLGNTHVSFSKAGYQDRPTTGIGKGSGACGDQQIVRDGTMEVQSP